MKKILALCLITISCAKDVDDLGFRTLMLLGWSQYNLNLKNKKMDAIKESTKSKNKPKTRKTRSSTRKTRK